MIFNKTSNGSTELRELTGSYYKSNDFDKIKTDVELASEDLTQVIGQAVFDKAETHYLSEEYKTGEQYALLDELVQHIQLPIAYLATLNFYQGNDLSHEDSGRKVKIDSDNEKLAWEWMYDRDDAQALRKYHKTTDRLLKFLEENEENISEWKESDLQKELRSRFIQTAEKFDSIFPIDKSRRFFVMVAPFMEEVERKRIQATIGSTKYDELKAAILADNVPAEDAELVSYIQDCIPMLTMAKAIMRLNIKVLPEGVLQQFTSNFQSRKASQPVTMKEMKEQADIFREEGEDLLDDLKVYWNSLQTEEDALVDLTDYLPLQDETDKGVCL